MVLGGVETDDQEGESRHASMLLGHERRRRSVQANEHDAHVGWKGPDVLANVAKRLGPPIQAPEEEAQVDHRPHLVEAELEFRDDPEVAPTAANRPEEVGVRLG